MAEFVVLPLADGLREDAARLVATCGHRRVGAIPCIAEPPPRGAALYRCERVAFAGNEMVGVAVAWEQSAGRCRCETFVAGRWWAWGATDALLTGLLSGIAAWPRPCEVRVQARAMADEADAPDRAALERCGFREVHRMARLKLDVASVDTNLLEPAIGKMAPLGVRLTTLAAERAAGRDPLPGIWQTKNAALSHWADPYGDSGPESDEPMPYDRFLEQMAWMTRPEAVFLAYSGDQCIGHTGLWADDSTPEGTMQTGETAVRPEWHGRGVASALKAASIRYAQAQGIGTLRTSTASAAMRAVNEKFGFYEMDAEIRYVRRVQTSGEAK